MRKDFQKLPPPLQKQVLFRFAAAALSLIPAALAALRFRDTVLCAPFLLFSLVAAAAGFALLTRSLRGGFVRVEGICTQIERTGIRRRPKVLLLSAGEHTVKIYLRGKPKNIAAGSRTVVYLADNQPVYQQDGYEIVNGYLAIETVGARRVN